MQIDYEGSVAFITGGASGAGLGQARHFGKLGCRIFLADIRADALDEALESLRGEGVTADGAQLDLMDRERFREVADMVEEVYGEPPRYLFNTAGVFAMGPTEASTYADYDWLMGVNFDGVVNGLVTLVPRMIEAGKGGHILGVSSVGGLLSYDGNAIYCAAKAAVIALLEAYRVALQKYDIGVSILCPMNIRSNIANSASTRPEHLARTGYVVDEASVASLAKVYANGMDPLLLAKHVQNGIEENAAYIIPYPEAHDLLKQRFDAILSSIPPMSSDSAGVEKRLATIDEWISERGDIFERKSDASPV